ncbi:USP6 N-terminal-like protein [Physocladia obscura]|uniref:USP6 N-terminal-like protein n=1 Tax=Physocladia obscura TaxID=109957 RepID=A0AAD5SX09_9FUNG|nr:USP6 N-terminal-like protein [Physocladia obscura]
MITKLPPVHIREFKADKKKPANCNENSHREHGHDSPAAIGKIDLNQVSAPNHLSAELKQNKTISEIDDNNIKTSVDDSCDIDSSCALSALMKGVSLPPLIQSPAVSLFTVSGLPVIAPYNFCSNSPSTHVSDREAAIFDSQSLESNNETIVFTDCPIASPSLRKAILSRSSTTLTENHSDIESFVAVVGVKKQTSAETLMEVGSNFLEESPASVLEHRSDSINKPPKTLAELFQTFRSKSPFAQNELPASTSSHQQSELNGRSLSFNLKAAIQTKLDRSRSFRSLSNSMKRKQNVPNAPPLVSALVKTTRQKPAKICFDALDDDFLLSNKPDDASQEFLGIFHPLLTDSTTLDLSLNNRTMSEFPCQPLANESDILSRPIPKIPDFDFRDTEKMIVHLTAPGGYPNSSRGRIWLKLIAGTKDVTRYEREFSLNFHCVCTIGSDIDREVDAFTRFPERADSLKKILRAFENREGGYTNAMLPIAYLLLTYMSQEKAYAALVYLYSTKDDSKSKTSLRFPRNTTIKNAGYGFGTLSTKDKLSELIFLHEKLLADWAPNVARKLAIFSITSMDYVANWFITLFESCYSSHSHLSNPSILPFRVYLRIMDILFTYGIYVIPVISASLLMWHEATIECITREELFAFLAGAGRNGVSCKWDGIDEDNFVEAVAKNWVNVSSQKEKGWRRLAPLDIIKGDFRRTK